MLISCEGREEAGSHTTSVRDIRYLDIETMMHVASFGCRL